MRPVRTPGPPAAIGHNLRRARRPDRRADRPRLRARARRGPGARVPPEHPLTPGSGVMVEVHAAGVSFPEVLQTRGEYQLKPPLPFVPGSEIAGVVREAPEGAVLRTGDRVAAFCGLGGGRAGGGARVSHVRVGASARVRTGGGTDPQLPHRVLRAGPARAAGRGGDGAGARRRRRGRHRGAAGREGLGARTIAVVSSEAKQKVAERAGAGAVVRSDGPWKDEAREISGGGVDLVLDPVGGDRFTDSLRSLNEGGRVVVVGFTGGSIPEVRVNRLLLSNTEIIGAGWGAYAMARPELCRDIGEALEPLIRVRRRGADGGCAFSARSCHRGVARNRRAPGRRKRSSLRFVEMMEEGVREGQGDDAYRCVHRRPSRADDRCVAVIPGPIPSTHHLFWRWS